MTITLRTTKGSALTFTEMDNNFREILDLRRAFIDQVTAGGTPDALTADFTRPVVLTNGVMVKVKIGSSNTIAGPTLNVNGTGAKTITGLDGGPLGAGVLPSGAVILFSYDNALDSWAAINFSSTDALTLNGQPASFYLDYDNMNAGTVLPANMTQATTASIGAARIATNAEAAAATLTDVFITPATAALAVTGGSQNIASNGHTTLAGGLLLNWGTKTVPADSTATAVFDEPFTGSVFAGFATLNYNFNHFDDAGVAAYNFGLASMTIKNGSSSAGQMSWWALGT